ncbi:hypothetical protein Pst134EA_028112 [Puccinia striiformis f. sp. tritici]|uniref:Uncharacterized protein n=1 Tax=Puccinia striiformis f. sp. tritici PST-78 TaxID=1165861 RepID=A0A0L0UQ21_9BASI|nr:hypothetical protein Pst134EA_028112 [Puccinia striiformis f. sp. tritici]KAH9448817.1 hypothetical protein Pst134EA_028112 [Puccinia striiformis f. sp. tritici]KAI9607757.1 hypothetical protein H4Q26_005202 [Puccinia striiformis f. sp. tritici PST-130]KNE89177.1 hypothetical protein PSTG_17365 [Puccinia striiformis f. sp. tritici PST-78]
MTESRPLSISSQLDSIRSNDPFSSEYLGSIFAEPVHADDPFKRDTFTIDEVHAFHTLITDLFRSFALSAADENPATLVPRMELYNRYYDLHASMITHGILDEYRNRIQSMAQSDAPAEETSHTPTEETSEVKKRETSAEEEQDPNTKRQKCSGEEETEEVLEDNKEEPESGE